MNEETKDLIETLAKDLTQEDIIRGEERAKGYVEGFKDGVESSRPTWIPCSERLPSNSDDVLITIKGDDFVASGTYAGYHSEQWWYLGEDGEITDVPITADVLAWMPLPEPWKGADDE